MKKISFCLYIGFLVFSGDMGFSQTTQIIEVRNFFFSPAEPTVQVGDTVRWVNIEGTHNVVADDNSFTSGSPASGSWTYDYVFTTPGLKPYYCSFHGGAGSVGMAAVIIVTGTTDTDEDMTSPINFGLGQNYPNPFNPATRISWQSPVAGHQTLKIYDILGNDVATLVDEYREAGRYEVVFQSTAGSQQSAAGSQQSAVRSRQLSSGVYFYRLSIVPAASRNLVLTEGQSGDPANGTGFIETKKMILIE